MKLPILILQLAGVSQIIMALGSLVLPRLLNWKQGLSKSPILLRQMFWVYAAYIFATNIWLGLVSLLFPKTLLEGGSIAGAFLIYACLYWLSRVGLQFFYFDKSHVPKGFWYRIGEIALDTNFILLALVYLGVVLYYFI